MLPTSRNTTYNAASSVRSADLDAIQDCIIGKKFPSTKFPIPGVAFVLDTGAPTRAGMVWTLQTNVADKLFAALAGWPWMPGTRITNVIWSFNRNSNNVSGELDLSLNKRSLGDGGATSAGISVSPINGGTGWTTHDSQLDGGLPYTLEDGFEFFLELATSNLNFSGTPFFDGVTVIADRL